MSELETQPSVLTGTAERGRVLMALRELEPELRGRGVRRLRLFGSMARGVAGIASDVDLLADIDRTAIGRFSLLDLIGLEQLIGDRLGRAVQITTSPEDLHPIVRARAERDAIEVFDARARSASVA